MNRIKYGLFALLLIVMSVASLSVSSDTARAASAFDSVITQGEVMATCGDHDYDISAEYFSILYGHNSTWDAAYDAALTAGVGWGVFIDHSPGAYPDGEYKSVNMYVSTTPTANMYFSSQYGAPMLFMPSAMRGSVTCVSENNGDPIWGTDFNTSYGTNREVAYGGTYYRNVASVNMAITYPEDYEGIVLSEGREYVAMGDSFSSGEGNPSFEYPTDIGSGTEKNVCHRSYRAYPRLLQLNPTLDIGHTSFVACSGATTSNVLNGGVSDGSWGENAQVDALSSSTDLVTITIGGNDIKFSDFARACIFTNCDSSSDEYAESWDIMTNSSNPAYLPTALNALFAEMQTKLTSGNSTVKVKVVGYPYVVTYGSWNNPYSLNCAYMSGGSATAAMTVVDKLNEKIKGAVDDLEDSRFTFEDPTILASPFWLHELCREDSFFNGIQVGQPDAYTFHPNQKGHIAYEELIRESIE